ncbi:PKD domain-containing protein [Portibacter lacus]|uniref:PKD domain-containing protein n=1 Tax=Portibacter lacus TaxID=1099794 RepID=A0AA37SPW7_9BACT|nr:PKD domain-containing protein [Portibacter lacus]GLR16671.1 hypothetical protein GCM10007940_12860 [Portibacter lacus]
MSKSYLSLLIFSFFVVILISSCKRDAPNRDHAIIEVDFLLNERDLEKFGLDYTEQEFERDNNDPNKVLTVKVGEPVKFKDTSKGSTSTSKRVWKLNDNEWEQAENDKKIQVPEFTHVFDAPGYHRISLYIEDVSYATKLIKVVSTEFSAEDQNIAATESSETEVEVAAVEPEKDDLFDTPVNSNTQEQAKPIAQVEQPKTTTKSTPPAKTTPPPPPPAKISNIDFAIKGNLMVGNTIELRDMSSPSSSIFIRQWDMGDGTTQKTKGGVYNQIYFSSGEKTITLCLNNSNQCTSKVVNIQPRPPRKEVVAEKPVEKPVEPKKPEIAKVEFKLPATSMVGTSVNLSDRSQPSSAVVKRKWSFGDGSPDLNTGKSAVSHIFNKAGTFTVKLCLNDMSDKCTTETITITEKPAPKPVEVAETKPAPTSSTSSVSQPNWLDTYEGTTPGRVGLLSSQKCDETTSEWHSGAAFINISPKKPMELDVAKVYASENGTIDIILTTGDKKETGVINNVQVNPGPSNIYLTDLAIILEPGVKYTLMIKPSDPNSTLKLENAVKCSPRPLTSDIVAVNYNDKFVLYDLKFFY